MKLLDLPRKTQGSAAVSVRLILVEEDAAAFEAPGHAEGSEQDAVEVVMLVQSRGEPDEDFVQRTLRRIGALERADRTITEGIIAVGPGREGSVADTRTANARLLLGHMSRAGRGELMLMVGSADHDERHALLALAGTLTAEATESVSIRVLFEQRRPEPERKSGIQALLASPRRDYDVADALAAG